MKKRVLIFPAGAENALEIYDSLRYNVNVEVFGASGKRDFAEYRYPKDHYIEGDFYINQPHFEEEFQQLLIDYKIDIIIPTHDTIALYFAENRNKFKAHILVSDAATAQVCREKRKMYQLISDTEFCPKVYESADNIQQQDFPVFVKPNVGAGAVNAFCAHGKEEITGIKDIENYVICEYLPGKELTVDCFTNRKGVLTFAGARSRDRIKMGIAFRSTIVEITEEIKNIANTLNARLKFFGAWYFQIRQDKDGKYKLLEIACRQAGTMTLYRHMGINFPLLGIFELSGIDTSFVLLPGQCQSERCIHTAFHYTYEYDKVFLDFDDTIIVNNKINTVLLRFMYQCVNQGKALILITRHEGELADIMQQHRISDSLFDKIIHITFEEKKTDYINPYKAIFIDNSFAERKQVYDAYHIPVFDVDTVDMLLEE